MLFRLVTDAVAYEVSWSTLSIGIFPLIKLK